MTETLHLYGILVSNQGLQDEINAEDSQISAAQNPSPAEQQAAQDADQLYALLQEFTEYAQDYLITKNPADKDAMNQILSKMPSLLNDLSQLSPQLPSLTQQAIEMLSQELNVLSMPDDAGFTANLFMFSLQLGQIMNAGMGPSNPTPGDQQAIEYVDQIFAFYLTEINDNLQNYYNSSGPAKQQYLQELQSALSSIQSVLNQMDQLNVSPAVKAVIQSLLKDLPASPDQDPNFCSDMIEFTKQLGAVYGLIDP